MNINLVRFHESFALESYRLMTIVMKDRKKHQAGGKENDNPNETEMKDREAGRKERKKLKIWNGIIYVGLGETSGWSGEAGGLHD